MLDPLTNQSLIVSLLALLAIAVLTDLRDRQIPNLVVVIGLFLGLVGHSWSSGISGFAMGASGACVGLLCLLPFYISGGMGAGDVKLMAMCGAFLGPIHIVVASAASLFVGGLVGIAWAFWQFSNAGDSQPDSGNSAIPFALAIGVGTFISLQAAPTISIVLEKGMS